MRHRLSPVSAESVAPGQLPVQRRACELARHTGEETAMPTMPTRPLGRGGPAISALGLGCMSLSGTYGDADDATSIALVHAALERGVTHLDSSDIYGAGHNETLLGQALAGPWRARAFLATKFGQMRRPDGQSGVDGSPAYVAAACEASLKRLNTEVIDLYTQHRVDPAVPIEETVGAMGRLVEQGKVRFLGLSEAAPATIRRAHATHPIAAVQTEFSLLYREEADATRAVTRELGISFVAYAPLGRGLLTGTVRTAEDVGGRRAAHPRFQPENLGKNLELVGRIEAMAARKNCSAAQLALAWLLAQGEDVLPIFGTRSLQRMEHNLGALDVALSPAEATELSAALPPGAAAGARYPTGNLKAVQL
jgi:aryl-alcohol dehydrogenase-like predicted oxidoreductase